MNPAVTGLQVFRTAIPMRSFEHAAASRAVAEAVVVRAEFADGSAGWGETLPREYVTGETLDSVVRDLTEAILPAARQGEIPVAGPGGRRMHAAACAMDLACWPRLGGTADRPRRSIRSRVSGVLGSADPAKTAKRLRLMWWYGLRDFKLKLGLGQAVDDENLRLAYCRLAKAIAAGKATLRVDVNGGWKADETPARVEALRALGVCVVEQPVFCPAAQLADLARKCALPLMADESLVTQDDAQALLAAPDRVWWNIRISKNGGLTRAIDLARLAAEKGVTFVAGCMVGESGLLSAAQRRMLELCPPPRFVEGNYGRFLLADDLTTRSLRFGYGGRLKALAGPGLGVEMDARKIERYGTPVAKA